MELLKKRIYSAAKTIANGAKPRSMAEALNQCVYLSPFGLILVPYVRNTPVLNTPNLFVSQDLYLPTMRLRILGGREPCHRARRRG